MSSDGQTVGLTISKEECTNCGTVRSADVSFLNDFYKNYYKLNIADNDPVYIYENESMPKSRMHYEWISKLLGIELNNIGSIIEIGCGSGNLLDLFNVKHKYGVEPSREASIHAAKKASVRNIGYETISDSEKYDLVLSTCVIEHTIDPNAFLKKNRNIVKDDGIVVIGLPIQDSESFDVYFLDHLHHFSSKQFIHLCQKNGFEVERFEVGYKCMTTIAYFILRKKDPIIGELNYEANQNFYTSQRWIDNLNKFIETPIAEKILAFGYGEASFFYQTYTKLNSTVKCYIDDVRADESKKVITSSQAISSGIINDSVLVLLANPHYHEYLKRKFETSKNLRFYSPFSNSISN